MALVWRVDVWRVDVWRVDVWRVDVWRVDVWRVEFRHCLDPRQRRALALLVETRNMRGQTSADLIRARVRHKQPHLTQPLPLEKPMPQRLSREAFRRWAERQPGRYERIDSTPVRMLPEAAQHVRIKARVWAALDRAITAAKGSSGNYRTMFAQTSDPSWPAQAGRPRRLCGQHCKSWVARLRGP